MEDAQGVMDALEAPPVRTLRSREHADGYMSDSSYLRYSCWAIHTENATTLATATDHEDAYDENADVERKVVGADGMAGAHRASHPVSWRDLEASCRKLDAAEIRISSLDLSCMEEEDNDDMPFDLFEADEDDTIPEEPEGFDAEEDSNGPTPSHNQQPHCSKNMSSKPPLLDAAMAPRMKTLPPGARSAGSGALEARQWGGSGTLEPKHCSPPVSSASFSESSSSKSSSGPQSSLGSGLLSSTSFTSHSSKGSGGVSIGSPAQLPSGSRPVTAGGGDIIEKPSPVQTPATPLGAPTRTASGVSCNQGPRVLSRPTQSLEEKLKEICFVPEEERPRGASVTRYSSMVLPGAVPRDARVVGVRKYIRAVKMKCGELFTTTKRAKS